MCAALRFTKALSVGQVGESDIAKYLRGRRNHILPVYEKIIEHGKGPRMFMAYACDKPELIAPDMLVFHEGVIRWVEAKTKARFTWYGIGKRWTTGIDRRHYNDYLAVREITGLELWLFFLHTNPHTWEQDIVRWGAPDTCPTGLFVNSLDYLRDHVDHESDEYADGMVYWCIDSLRRLAAIEAVRQPEREAVMI